jgi:hypothetical protein
MFPIKGKIYKLINNGIPLWNIEINSDTIDINKDFICRIKPQETFLLIDFKIVNNDKNLLYAKILTSFGKVGTFCIFEDKFKNWFVEETN